jgi:hypothetical protein
MLFLGFIDIDFIMEIPSPRLSFTSFKMGPSTLQGPHQVAKKSIRTGFSDFIILSKLLFILFFFKVDTSHPFSAHPVLNRIEKSSHKTEYYLLVLYRLLY